MATAVQDKVYPYQLTDIKILDYDDPTTTYADLDNPQELGVTLNVSTSELMGGGRLIVVGSQANSVGWSFNNAGVPLKALSIMLGATLTTEGTGATLEDTLPVSGGECLPNFKIFGKLKLEDCTGDFHIILPKCKITGEIAFNGSGTGGDFANITTSGMAVHDDTAGYMVQVVRHATAEALPVS
jgi:hypothetical protein